MPDKNGIGGLGLTKHSGGTSSGTSSGWAGLPYGTISLPPSILGELPTLTGIKANPYEMFMSGGVCINGVCLR